MIGKNIKILYAQNRGSRFQEQLEQAASTSDIITNYSTLFLNLGVHAPERDSNSTIGGDVSRIPD
jgi:hypothetical protein